MSKTPTDAQARKAAPLARGCLDYFPRALLAVAELSRVANEQHNPGEEMHWAREKSADHADCLMRHLIDRGTVDTDGQRHATKVAWRALAMLELELEGAPVEGAEAEPPTVEPAHPRARSWASSVSGYVWRVTTCKGVGGTGDAPAWALVDALDCQVGSVTGEGAEWEAWEDLVGPKAGQTLHRGTYVNPAAARLAVEAALLEAHAGEKPRSY